MHTSMPTPSKIITELQSAPITRMLGAQIQSLDLTTGTLVTHYTADEQFLNPARQVQGGMLGAMLDDVTAVLVTATLEPGSFCATLNLNVSFLSSAVPGTLVGKASFERRGKSICHVRGEIWQGETLTASAVAVCMVRKPR